MKAMKLAATAASLSLMLGAGSAAHAQFYYAAPDLSTPPMTGAEPQLNLNLPGASADELKAGLLWHLRVAMNVAALQCDFEPSLLTVSNYNATLAHHRAELGNAYGTLQSYFTRVKGSSKAGTTALDVYNTKTYSGYSTVNAQKDFCLVVSKTGRDAIFADRGNLYQVAQKHIGEIRKALVPTGEQYFTNPGYNYRAVLPDFGKKCWKKDSLTSSCANAWKKNLAAAAPAPAAAPKQ